MARWVVVRTDVVRKAVDRLSEIERLFDDVDLERGPGRHAERSDRLLSDGRRGMSSPMAGERSTIPRGIFKTGSGGS
jgi:hypothetical protein